MSVPLGKHTGMSTHSHFANSDLHQGPRQSKCTFSILDFIKNLQFVRNMQQRVPRPQKKDWIAWDSHPNYRETTNLPEIIAWNFGYTMGEFIRHVFSVC